MNTKSILTLLRTPDLRSALLLQRDLHTLLRVHVLYAAFDSGLLQTLRTPSTLEQIATSLQAQRRDLLEGLLDLGIALGEIAQDAGRYRLRGRRARSLAKAEGDPLAALLQETVSYHGSVYQGFAARLRGGALGDYLAGTGELVARSSRVLEPYIGGFVQAVVASGRPLRLLEVGCGSGAYLRWAAEANPGVTGLAIDMQADVVNHARANLADWGIAGRFDVRVANILAPPADLTGPFDLATLYNNIYYFPVDARIDLFHRLRSLLAPDGALALVSTMRSDSLDSLNFDLVLRSTLGCAPLPELDELTGQLQASGFGQVEPVQLIPGGWLYGVLARNQGA
jgi:hypothetical protein